MLRAARIMSASGGLTRALRAASGAAPARALALARFAHGEAAVHRVRAAAAPEAIAVPGFVVTAPHARTTTQSAHDYMLSHPVYTPEEVETLNTSAHFAPAGPGDRLAQLAINVVRGAFDALTGYKPAPAHNSVSAYLTRIIFLETVAGVPGMVASMVRHFESLRLLRRDNGWIHTLLTEAENERMHLLTFLSLTKPSLPFRAAVLVTQGVFFNAFFLAYLVMPSTCHRFVGFLEEEAVTTYTHIIADLDAGKLPEWQARPASALAKAYWRLPETAMMRDVLLAIRADEAIHRDVNHVLASIKKTDKNPFA